MGVHQVVYLPVSRRDLTLEGFLLMRRLGLEQLLVQVEHPLHQLDHLVMPRPAAGIESGDWP